MRRDIQSKPYSSAQKLTTQSKPLARSGGGVNADASTVQSQPVQSQSVQSLLKLLDTLPIAIYALSRDYKITMWNEGAARLYGWTADEVIGFAPKFVSDEQKEGAQGLWFSAMNGDHIQDFETARIRKDGSVIRVCASSATLRDAAGEIECVVVTATDLTSQSSAASMLSNRLDITRQVVEAIPCSFYFKSLDGKYLGFNQAFERLTGLDRDQIIGRDLHDLFSDADAKRLGQKDAQLLADGFLPAFEDQVEVDGKLVDLLHRKAVFTDSNGKVGGIVGLISDVTQARQAEAGRLISEERLKLALEAGNQGMWDVDLTCNCLTVDNTAKQWLGMTSNQADDSILYGEVVKPLNPAKAWKSYVNCVKAIHRQYEATYYVDPPGGVPRVLSVIGCVTEWGSDGRALRLTGTLADITEQMAQRQVQQERDEQLRLISENVNELIVMVNSQGRIAYCSSSATHWFADQSGIENAVFNEFLHTDDRVSFDIAFSAIVADGQERTLRASVVSSLGVSRCADINLKMIDSNSTGATRVLIVGRDVSERLAMDKRLEYLAHFDQLTGVANRTLLRERTEHALSRARRFKEQIGVMFIDLDDFKRVNDNFGHARGDQLLRIVSQRLKEVLRDSDTVARQGGDEFIILLGDVTSVAQAQLVGQRVLKQFEEPIDLGGSMVDVSASIGIALYPGDGNSVDELFARADAAMYQAKGAGKNRLELFTAEIRAASIKRSHMESALKNAVQLKQFFLLYQPQIDLASGQLIGAEALIRWQHPELGLVNPLDFIPIAEDTGAIIDIGQWVLGEACRQAFIWQQALGSDFKMAVNVSARQWAHSDFALSVAQKLSESGLDARSLELELTESVMMKNLDASLLTMSWLKSIGVSFALDDFGTGYSSLSYLKRFDVSQVKIDRSFIRDVPGDPHDVAIVKAILAMAAGLEIQVTAEGIETVEQQDFLKFLGCQFGQGYLISRPVSSADFTAKYANQCVASDGGFTAISVGR